MIHRWGGSFWEVLRSQVVFKRPGENSRRALDFVPLRLLQEKGGLALFYSLVGVNLRSSETLVGATRLASGSRLHGSELPLASLQPRLLSRSSSDAKVRIVPRSQL
jgi:hypothetical protein